MKIHPQTIYKDDRPEFIVLPIKEYDRLLKTIEDYQDIQEVRRHIENPGEKFPVEVAEALADGINPIKVFREYRGITQMELAAKVKVSKQYISQLENSERAGSTKVLKAIAEALYLNLDDLT
ncbi:MAG TPA: helix-turn-helix transcriptional regulator [Gammaproteobacteria bacterium]|nr:helix-turn-helix transcriptional regulator [Gammaproteobacteria bacterium]